MNEVNGGAILDIFKTGLSWVISWSEKFSFLGIGLYQWALFGLAISLGFRFLFDPLLNHGGSLFGGSSPSVSSKSSKQQSNAVKEKDKRSSNYYIQKGQGR